MDTPPPIEARTPASGFLRLCGVALLAGYLILSWIGACGGISSQDAHGIIRVVNEQVQSGTIQVSRPPGHPLNEYWVLPNVVRLMHLGGGGPALTPFGYSLYQLAGGLICLGFFWLLLGQFSISPARRLLATACLAFSPNFLITSSEGEEFNWGMACVFAALLVLTRLSTGATKSPLAGWFLSVAFAVAASGYRVEYGGVALLAVFVTLLFSDQSWPRRIGLGVFACGLFLLIWMPVLLHQGVSPPYDNPLSILTRIAVGVYKIAFQSFGVVPFVIALTFLFQARGAFRILPPFRQNLLGYWALWLVVIFFCLFFLYPTKILVVLPGVAFLILLGAAYAERWTWSVFVLGCMALQLVHVDCFDNRQWVGPIVRPGLWAQDQVAKPAAMRPRIDAGDQIASTGRHVVIVNVWAWSLDWQKQNAGWAGVPDPESTYEGWFESYNFGPGMVASRSILDNHSKLLAAYVSQGYDLWVDKGLYRERYMRYNLNAPTPETAVIDGLPYHVVEMK